MSRGGCKPAANARRSRGGILLELLLAIALFVGAAMFTLSALGDALEGMRRTGVRARAADLAESRLAEIDAGLVSIGDLADDAFEDDDAAPGGDNWIVEFTTVPSRAGGPVSVRATVRDASVDGRPILATRERIVEFYARAPRQVPGGSR